MPVSDGWFVVNMQDAAWITNAAFGARCVFQSDGRVLRNRPDLTECHFPDLGITVAVQHERNDAIAACCHLRDRYRHTG